ncbi:hypothetical protein Aduo_016309 [Ancylostoma duodenale]
MNSPVSSGESGASQRRSRYMRRKMAISNPYVDMSQENGFFTSTPYRGFHPVLPPISSIYSPLASYYTQYQNLSSYSTDSSTPSTSSVSEQSSADRCSPPPRLVAYSTSQSEDSGFLSTSSAAETTPVSRTTVRGYKKTYCMICKVNINKEGKRSQGPRRHLLQHHVRRPLFQCPHCSHSSFYDKFHVTSHMRRIHQDHSDRLINRSSEFEDEVDLWYQRCFGEVGEARAEQAGDPKEQGGNQLSSSPPPVLTPELMCKENINPDPLPSPLPIRVPAPRRRKMGFMVADLLQLSPKQANSTEDQDVSC